MLVTKFKTMLKWKNYSNIISCCKSTVSKVSVNGVDLAYMKVGSGDHAILLLPGALGCGETDYAPQISGINREKFTIVAFDPRGYGKSIPPKRDFPDGFFRRDADDATELMLKVGFQSFSTLGWSDGGNTAAILAAKYPDKINKLVLWGANSFVTKEEIEMYEKLKDISQWSERMRKPMVDLYGEEYFRLKWKELVDAYSKMYHEKDGDNYKGDLKHITAPTLIIHGMKDTMVPFFHAEYLHKNIKGSVLDCWPDGKHNLHLRYADKFNSQVEEFLLKGQNNKLLT